MNAKNLGSASTLPPSVGAGPEPFGALRHLLDADDRIRELERTIKAMGKLNHQICEAMNAREFAQYAGNPAIDARIKETSRTDAEVYSLASEAASLGFHAVRR